MKEITALTEIALAAGKKLTTHCKDIDSRYIHSYPEGCCELVAVHLGSVLDGANFHKKLQIVRAYNRDSDDWHYWVEMDDLGSGPIDFRFAS